MNFNHLRVFVDVAETLSFSQSALNLNIAQPAVSKTIKTLEESLGVQLFTRNNRKVFLTQKGKELNLSIRPLIENIEDSVLKIQDDEASISGEIRIGALVEFTEYRLMPIINELNNKYSEVLFKVDMKGDRELRDLFLEGKLDIYLGIKPMTAENIKSFKCFDQKSILLTGHKAKTNKLKIEEMKFVAYRDNDPLILAFIKKFYPNKSYQSINKAFVANSHKAIVDYISENEGCYGILPELSNNVVQALKERKLKPVQNKFLDSPIYISYWDHEFMSPSLKYVIDRIRSN